MEPPQAQPIIYSPDIPKGKDKKEYQSSSSLSSSKLSIYFLITSVTLLILFQIRLLKHPLQWPQYSNPKHPFTSLPLKDLHFAETAMDGNTWFMSSLNDTFEQGEAEYLFFPSDPYDHKLLCISGRDRTNGTWNSYGLADSRESLPEGAKLMEGLSFISDTYYDYENLWHGLSAVVPFMAWHGKKGCLKPARWVLYHRGELRLQMSPWVRSLVEAVFGEEAIRIEDFEGEGKGPNCFEKAVVFRHNEGRMSPDNKKKVYDMMRCKARASCRLSGRIGDDAAVRLTLLMRVGPRSFKDEKAVVKIFERECWKVEGCRLKVVKPNNMSFCDQVKLMKDTDILASTHGAQLTNMFFMDKKSRVMEFFPKGWKELAGVGQYVFQWIAGSSGIMHEGPWHDPDGDPCPYAGKNSSQCFRFYKNGLVGHNETYFAKWAAKVIKEMKEYKLSEEYRRAQQDLRSGTCLCG